MFERRGMDEDEYEEEIRNTEKQYKQRLKECKREVLRELEKREQTMVAAMIERHTQEMLLMIAEKVGKAWHSGWQDSYRLSWHLAYRYFFCY